MSLLNVNKIAPQSGTDFTLGDSGDTFTVPSGATLTVAGTLTQTGAQTFDGGVDIDNFNINGTTIALSSGDMTLDVAWDIILNTDDGIVRQTDASVAYGELTNSSSDFVIQNKVDAKDIIFKQFDGTTTLTLDDDTTVKVATDLTVGDDLSLITDSAVLKFGADGDATLTHTNDTGLTLNSTNKLMFNDASQYIQGASATVLDIAATDEIELTATEVEINVTTLDVNGNLDVSGTTLLPTLGVITAKDLGAGIHIRTADSGASVSSEADELVIEHGNAIGGMTFLAATDGVSKIAFGDSGDNDIGMISYSHDNNHMLFNTNAVERLRIASNGEVSVNDGQVGTGAAVFKIKGAANNDVAVFTHGTSSSANEVLFRFRDGSNTDCGTIGINPNSNSVAYNTSSDYRLKENESAISDGITRLKQLKPYRFNWKSNSSGDKVDGFFAHEVSSIVPEAISGEKDGFEKYREHQEKPEDKNVGDFKLNEKDEKIPEYQQIDQSKLVPLLTSALQEAITKIETLEARIKTLEDA